MGAARGRGSSSGCGETLLLLLLLGASSELHCEGGEQPALPRLSLSSNLLLQSCVWGQEGS